MTLVAEKLLYPGTEISVISIDDAAAMAPAVDTWNDKTIYAIAALGQNSELTLTADAEIRVGARVLVYCDDCNNFKITFAGDAAGVRPIGGSNGKFEYVELEWNGTAFVAVGQSASVDIPTIATTGTVALTVWADDTFVSVTPTGAITLNVTADSSLRVGARLHLKSTGGGTNVITLGTGIDAIQITNVSGKTQCQSFVWNGTTFFPFGAVQQID